MKKREYRDYINDIKEALSDCELFIQGMTFELFVQDKKTMNAVIRSIEVIGEASKNIAPGIREKNHEIPWAKMAGMWDKLIHQYFGVASQILWKTVTEDLPKLRQVLDKIRI